MPNLILENVSYVYKSAPSPAVSGVSCEFEPGTMYSIVGPSGSGKSTLLSIMAGLDRPTSGDIYLGDANLKELDLDRYRREDVAMIFQSFRLFPLLTVVENVCYPLELCGVKPKAALPRAEKLLERVGITQAQMKRYPSHLSGGGTAAGRHCPQPGRRGEYTARGRTDRKFGRCEYAEHH